ncbi:Sec-independent protein translocase family protein [Woodsholea maritima]|uniref:hypothetical protein n=1 Tax=Woodsholea maritima TaxID=240237 RepID=UPI00035C70F8|nr:hypothetical protein [Woodsholea maritima]
MAPHWTGLLIVGLLLLVLFGGRGKISSLMGDVANGITAFRKGLKDDNEAEEAKPQSPTNLPKDEIRESEKTGG